MQRLDVSGAVRPLLGSLDVKGLICFPPMQKLILIIPRNWKWFYKTFYTGTPFILWINTFVVPPSKSAPILIPRSGTERNYATEFPLYEIPLHELLNAATRRHKIYWYRQIALSFINRDPKFRIQGYYNVTSLNHPNFQTNILILRCVIPVVCRMLVCFMTVLNSKEKNYMFRPIAAIFRLLQLFSQYHIYTGCPRRNVPDFRRVFLMLNYTDITQNTYIQSWTVTEIMAREVWNFDSCYSLIDYQIHIKTGRNMWFL